MSTHRARTAFSCPALSLLVLGMLCAAVGPSVAGDRAWSGPGPRAKGVEDVVRDPQNAARMWAATFGAGVYRSLDGGATWTAFRTGLVNTYVRCLAVNPHHPDSLFCGTNDGVYVSVDGGATWKEVRSTSVSVRSIAIHPIHTAVVYAATYGTGIYKSVNGGSNWSTINIGLVNTNVRDVELHPVKPDTLFAATGTGGGIHRSFNGGLSWSQVPDTTATLGAAEQIRIDALDPNRIYAAELDRGVLKSADGGTSWVRVNRGLPTLRTRSIALVDTLRYVGLDGRGVCYTTLNDSTWHPGSAGLGAAPVVDALLGTVIGAPVFAGTDGDGVFRTAAADTHWTQLDGGLLATYGFSLCVRPADHVVFDGTGFGDQFWRSTNQGATWTRNRFLFTHDSERAVVVDPLLAHRVYMSAYGSGVYRSDDDGDTWFDPDSLNRTLTNLFVRALVAVPGVSGHLFVGTGIGVFESLDAAQTWAPVSHGLPSSFSVRALAVVPGATPRLFAGSDSAGIYRSDDGGANWAVKNTGLGSLFVHSILVDSTNPLIVYAATDSGVFKSTSAGDAWLPARAGLPAAASVRTLAQDLSHPAVLFSGVWGGGVFESLDQGVSWGIVPSQNALPSLNVFSVVVDGALPTVYAGTEAGVSELTNYVTTVAVPMSAPHEASLALSVWPNPAVGGTARVSFTLPRPGAARVSVYGLDGARVRDLVDAASLAAGTHATAWDGSNARGVAMPPGLYFIRLDSSFGSRDERLVRLTR